MYNLVSFPDYSIDIQTGKVYSHKFGKTKEIKGYTTGKNTQLHFSVRTPDKAQFNASIGRLIASAKYGCDYFTLPKDVMFNWTQAEGLTTRSRRENAIRGAQQAEERDNRDRIAILDRVVQEMGLVREAYLGNIKPLSLYLHEHRDHYVEVVMRSRLSQGVGGAPGVSDVVDDCIFVLIDNIVRGKKNIILLEPWIFKTAIGLIKARRARRHVDFVEEMTYSHRRR